MLEDETNLHPNSQEEIGLSQNSEIACTGNLSNDLSYGDDHLLLQGNNEHKFVFLDSCDSQIDILPVEAHDKSNILEVVISFKFSHEHPKHCLLDEWYEEIHSFVVLDYSFYGFLFQNQVCEDQDEIFDERHEQGYLGIHYSYVSPAHPFFEALFQGQIHANHNFELAFVEVSNSVVMVENNHQTLQVDYEEESNDKEEVVSESLAHDDFRPKLENEEWACISADFQDMVTF